MKDSRLKAGCKEKSLDYNRKNNIFSKVDKKNAKELLENEWNKNTFKILRRLHTFSYDIKDKASAVIYMAGLNAGEVSYLVLNERCVKFIWKIIFFHKTENIEMKFYYSQIENFAKTKFHLAKGELYDKLIRYTQYQKPEKDMKQILTCFLKYSKRQYRYGKELNGLYIKFSFSEEKEDNFCRYDDGKFYKYIENTIAKENLEGSGFSFGKIDKAFYYFQYGHYGEQLMFVKPLQMGKYYIQEYECLGRELSIEKISNMGNVTDLKIILKSMTNEMKQKFFRNIVSDSFSDSFGSVDIVVDKMKEYNLIMQDGKYNEAITFLLNEKNKYC